MKKILALALATLMLLSMAACAAKTEPAAETTAPASADQAQTAAAETQTPEEQTPEVQHVVYAFPGTAARLNYVNDDGSFGGYEIDIIKELDKRLDDVEFELYCCGEFSALTPGLDAKKFDMVGSAITWKQERADNYLYSTVTYFHTPYAIGVPEDCTDINTLDDLGGKHMIAIPGTGATLFLEAFNDLHPENPIQLDYVEATSVDNIGMMVEGRCDAVIGNVTDFAIAREERDYQFKVIDLTDDEAKSIEEPDSFFLFRKDEAELQQKVDACLKEMRDDGTLSKLILQYFDEDFSALPEGYTGDIH